MTLSTALGSIYYQSENGVRTQFRIVRYIDENTVEVKFLDGNKQKMKLKDITENWYLLEPDGFVNFSIVEINELNDVVVTMVRADEIETGIPWCVCRQNINNIFEEYVSQRKDGVVVSGVSISQETIPAGLNILAALAGDKLIKTWMVAIYNTDKLDDILQCIKIKPFNKTLEIINQVKLDSVNSSFIKKLMSEKESYAGCHKTLEGLLVDNDFMHDVYRGFGMYVVDNIYVTEEDIIKGDFKDGAVIDPAKIVIIEKEYAHRLTNPLIAKYDKDVNLDEFKNSFLIVDRKDDKYVVIYDDESSLYNEEKKLSPDERLRNIM